MVEITDVSDGGASDMKDTQIVCDHATAINSSKVVILFHALIIVNLSEHKNNYSTQSDIVQVSFKLSFAAHWYNQHVAYVEGSHF